jgi:hypothetical protein
MWYVATARGFEGCGFQERIDNLRVVPLCRSRNAAPMVRSILS